MTNPVLAFDIGGTTTRIALVDGETLYARREIATPSRGLLDAILGLAAHIPGPVAGVAIGVPEYVHDGQVTSSEVIDWDPAIVDALAGFGPLMVESDVRCAAIAEWTVPDSLLYLSWGTGLSTALVLPEGTAWTGQSGRAIAFGEREVSTGVSLESAASGRGVETRYTAATGVRQSVRTFAASDATAKALLEESGRLVGRALLDLARVLDPARVVVGGGLGMAETPAFRALEQTWNDANWPTPSLQRARLGNNAGLVGAATLFHRTLTS